MIEAFRKAPQGGIQPRKVKYKRFVRGRADLMLGRRGRVYRTEKNVYFREQPTRDA